MSLVKSILFTVCPLMSYPLGVGAKRATAMTRIAELCPQSSAVVGTKEGAG